jgi:hypothetical protein
MNYIDTTNLRDRFSFFGASFPIFTYNTAAGLEGETTKFQNCWQLGPTK